VTRYRVLWGADKREEELEVRELGPGLYEVRVRGRVRRVDAFPSDPETLSLILEGKSHPAVFDGAAGGGKVKVGDSVFPIEVLDERRLRLRRPAAGFTLDGRQEIHSPLPGTVRKLLRRVGDEVRRGEALLVLEALQMENELKSPKAGRVVEVLVAEGEAVERGARLASVE